MATMADYIAGTWKIDPAHSEINFTVRHLAISKVRGTFEKFDVTVVTGESPTDSSVVAEIDVSSVNTRQEARDNHLRSSDFFLVDQHPMMIFRSSKLTMGSGEDFELQGELTLRGVTLPIGLSCEIGGVLVEGGVTKVGVSATTSINRHDYGVSWNAALEAGGFTLGDTVTIDIDLQLVLQ